MSVPANSGLHHHTGVAIITSHRRISVVKACRNIHKMTSESPFSDLDRGGADLAEVGRQDNLKNTQTHIATFIPTSYIYTKAYLDNECDSTVYK